MQEKIGREERERFCRAYLQTMDPARAAEKIRRTDGEMLLKDAGVKKLLHSWRKAESICRTDVVRRLCELAFGRANDAVKLALSPGGQADAEGLDLSAVAEYKVTDKGMEVKFIDRVRALEVLWNLLEDGEDRTERFLQALDAMGGKEES